MLTSKSNTQIVMPFTGLDWPGSVAVDEMGNVYVADHADGGRVVKLSAN